MSTSFEEKYRLAVAHNLDVFPLIGVDASLPNRLYQLSVAYISPAVLQLHTPRNRIPLLPPWLRTDGPERSIMSVDAMLASSHRQLILGVAGAGKTTLLQWIAVRAATKTFNAALNDWNSYLPFYIHLRHYSTFELPQPAEFSRYAAPLILDEMPPEWVNSILRSGRALILVDSVDEMVASRRKEVYTWLNNLAEAYHHCRFIVTSRPHAIEPEWMKHAPFDSAILQEMTLADISSFINRWHQAIALELPTQEEKDALPLLAEHLKKYILQTRPIRTLATNPLLCALLCVLNREHRGQLPTNGIELYQASSSLLLERRAFAYLEAAIASGEELRQDGEQHAASLIPPKNMQEAQILSVAADFALKNLYLPHLIQKGPLLVSTVAACVRTLALIGGDAALDLLEYYTQDTREMVVTELLNAWDNFDHEPYAKRILTQICKKRSTLTFSQLLSLDGIEHLANVTELNLSGTQVSDLSPLAVLTDLTRLNLSNTQVKDLSPLASLRNLTELNLSYMEIGDLSSLARLENLTLLKLSFIRAKDLSSLASLRNLRVVDLFNAQQVSDLSPLADLRNLTELNLSHTQVSDLSPLAGLQNLTTLDLSSTQVGDLSPLASLTNLTTLKLFNALQLRDLSPLVNLKNLTELDIFNALQLRDLSPLANLKNLVALKLSTTHASPLASLTNLTTLNLFHTRQVKDLSMLANLKKLTTLRLSNAQHVHDLSQLKSLTSLTTLYLANTQQTRDLSMLTSLKKLTTLYLSSMQVSDLSPLASLTNLTKLNLSYMPQVSDLSPLASLTGLTTLDLSNMEVSDLSPLANLTNLATLYLFNMQQVSDLSPLANLTNLTRLYLINTQVTDMTSLTNLPKLEQITV